MQPGPDPDEPRLAAELLVMRAQDEATRSRLAKDSSFFRGYHHEMRHVHRRNGNRLNAIFDVLAGWPGYQLVGPDGSEAAWFIANHDIANPAIMRRARDLMSDAVTRDQASATQLAYLVDRIAYFEHGHQIYGTQRGWDNDGYLRMWPPLTEPDAIDQRRRQVGLGPLAETAPLTPSDPARPTRLSSDDLHDLRQRELQFMRSVGWRANS